MNDREILKNGRKDLASRAVILVGAAALLGYPAAAFSDQSYSMAPPISSYRVQEQGDTSGYPENTAPTPPVSDPGDTGPAPMAADPDYTAPSPDQGDTSAPPPPASQAPAASTVFNWKETPVNQKIPLNRAVFDQGGYQLYDTVGETIVVPFVNHNLYVMKFAESADDTMYFINTGSAPVLYVPQDGYLENATVPGAKWYPFTQDFQPSDPVYLGVAPSWSDFVGVGWYPDMACYGGYWCADDDGIFDPCLGFCITFGGNRFFGWGDYVNFCGDYPAPFFLGFYHHGIYGFGGRGYRGGRSFHGGFAASYYHGGYSGGGHFGGYGEESRGVHVFRGAYGDAERAFSGRGSYGGSYSDRSFGSGGFRNSGEYNGSFRSGGFSGGDVRSEGSGGGFRSGGYSGGGFRSEGSGGSFHGGGSSGGGFRGESRGSGASGGFRGGGNRR